MVDRLDRNWALFHRAWRIRRPDGVLYLTRWRILQLPILGVYLHRFDGADPDFALHCHPWSFVSILLRGGYIEYLDESQRSFGTTPAGYHTRRVNAHRAEDRHRIATLYRHPTWSLVIVGRRRREWGFWPNGHFVPWSEYWGEGIEERA